MAPSAYTSARGPIAFSPRACSGAMYAGVPRSAPVRVMVDERSAEWDFSEDEAPGVTAGVALPATVVALFETVAKLLG